MSIRLLTEDEIWDTGKGNELQVLSHNKKCVPTDLAILLGCNFSQEGDELHTMWWSSTYNQVYVSAVHYNEGYVISPRSVKHMAIRPAVSFNELKLAFDDLVIGEDLGKSFVCYAGVYPQKLVLNTKKLSCEDNLEKTGKFYTFNASTSGNRNFNPVEVPEYILNGKKYIKITANIYENNKSKAMTDSTYNINSVDIKNGEEYWVEVKPIKWLVDKETGIAVADEALIAGIPMNSTKFDNFEETLLYDYLNTYFAKEIQSSKVDKNLRREVELTC